MNTDMRGGIWPLEYDFNGRHGRTISKMHCISIDAGDWMKRDDMKKFMESAAGWEFVGEGNWPSTDTDGELPSHGDRFMWVDEGKGAHREGSDWIDLPDDVATEIGKILDAERFQYGIVWLKPFDPHN